jgi:hypothetical protein
MADAGHARPAGADARLAPLKIRRAGRRIRPADACRDSQSSRFQ